MDVDKIIQMAINEPTIFLINSKDFINKVKLFQFQSQIKRVDYNERPEYYNINNEEVYKRIFTMLIKRHFGNFHISPQQVIEYIKSEPNEFYEFIIPQNEHNKKFIKFVEKTLEQNLGKVNARFIILEKNKY